MIIINTKTAVRPNTKTPTIWPLLPRCIVDKGKLKESGEYKEDTGAVPNVFNNIIR